jgi:cell shape-determining protein MreC
LGENENAKILMSEYQKLYNENEQNKKLVQELQDLKQEITMLKQFSNLQPILD